MLESGLGLQLIKKVMGAGHLGGHEGHAPPHFNIQTKQDPPVLVSNIRDITFQLHGPETLRLSPCIPLHVGLLEKLFNCRPSKRRPNERES